MESGVYVISLSRDPDSNNGLHKQAPLSDSIISEWISQAYSETERLVYGTKPNQQLATDKIIRTLLEQFWLPNENILYIGASKRGIMCRICDFYKHTLGNNGPHRGGQWVLTIDQPLYIHWAIDQDPMGSEKRALEEFSRQANRPPEYSGKLLPFGILQGNKHKTGLRRQ